MLYLDLNLSVLESKWSGRFRERFQFYGPVFIQYVKMCAYSMFKTQPYKLCSSDMTFIRIKRLYHNYAFKSKSQTKPVVFKKWIFLCCGSNLPTLVSRQFAKNWHYDIFF